MRILCLHGRGSNNEIFRAQTAFLRSQHDDYEFDFIQGTELHTEGNWSLYTAQFSNSPLYTYYNPMNPESVRDAENKLLDLIEQEGGYDGVLGYSGGAAFAAQAIIRHAQKNPSEPLFRFAIFINGGTPLKLIEPDDQGFQQVMPASDELKQELETTYLRPSNLRVRKGDNKVDAEAAIESRKKEMTRVQTGRLADGRDFLSDGSLGLTRYDDEFDGVQIDVPTLHIRCPSEKDANLGLKLRDLCDPSVRKEYFHPFGHDFPRGQDEMRQISRMITELVDSA